MAWPLKGSSSVLPQFPESAGLEGASVLTVGRGVPSVLTGRGDCEEINNCQSPYCSCLYEGGIPLVSLVLSGQVSEVSHHPESQLHGE